MPVFDIRIRDLALGQLAHHVQLALEGVFVHAGSASDKDLLDVRLRGAGHPANGVPLDRSVPPAEYREALFAEDALQNAFHLQALMFLDRQKTHSHRVLAGLRQGEAQLGTLTGEEFMRNLNQYASAVAGFRIAAAGAAVGQIDQYLDALENDLVALLPPNVSHKPHAASVMFTGRVIQPLGGG